MTDRLSVSELFGPTIQGEGPTQGRAVFFLRLGLCNLDCRWCDTPYTWDWTGKNGTKFDRENELVSMPVTDIASQIVNEAGPVRRLVITGGEPLIQKARLTDLVELLEPHGFTFEIETNGTLLPTEKLANACQFNVSPKLAGSGIDVERRIDYGVLTLLAQLNSSLKFVLTEDDDIDEVEQIVDRLPITPERVYLMPEGIDSDTILTALPSTMRIAQRRGWSISPRLHVLAHGNRRGI